jgi:hypothetical protein
MSKKPWPMEEPARKLAERLSSTEILKLDDTTAALVLEQDGVDYLLTMTRAPRQRIRQ